MATSCDKVLTNDLILRNIFDFLPVADLKNVRLTNRLWRDECRPIFQTKSALKLSDNVKVDVESSVMENFLATFATMPSTRLPFRNYKLYLFKSNFNGDAMDAFLEKFGPSMETLQISWTCFVGLDIVRDMLFNLTPKLKTLKIIDCIFFQPREGEQSSLRIYKETADVDENVPVNTNLTSVHFCGGRYTNLPISWEEIFRAFPNLKDLSFYNLSTADTDAILQVAMSLKTKNPKILQLEKLNIFNGDYATREIAPPVMDRLTSMKLSLRELSIDLGITENFHRTALLLEQQRKVRKMILYRGPFGTPMKKFPFGIYFPNLEYFEINDNISECMEFLQFMPNLKIFALKDPPEVQPPFPPTDTIAKTDINFTKMPLLTKVTTLIINYDISSADVQKLVFWFPAVVKARLFLDNDGFRTVCGEWRKLEELEVLGDRLDNEGITGIPETRSGETPVKKFNPINITELKYLRKFIMVYYTISTSIDDLSITEGFLKMPSLNYLELCSKHISKQGWSTLFNWAQLRTLLPSDGPWNSPECQAFKKCCYQLS